MEAVKNLNGEMWIFAGLLIGIVIVQAVLFLRLALKWNKKNSYFTDTEVKHLLKLGSVSVIGPSMSVMVVALSLIAMVGSGLTFMRVGVIGAASYEMMIADTAANAIGARDITRANVSSAAAQRRDWKVFRIQNTPFY